MGLDITQADTAELHNNSDVYVKSAIRALFQNDPDAAILEINMGIDQCDSGKKSYYTFEKVKILYGAKQNLAASQLIEEYLEQFYTDFVLQKFKEVLVFLNKSGKYSNNQIQELLDIRNIPWVLAEEYASKNNKSAYFEEQAEKYKNSGDYSRAISYADLVLKLNETENAYFIKAHSFNALQKKDQALYFYNKTIELNKANHSAYYENALLLASMGKPDAAIECIDQAIKVLPGEIKYINYKGELLIEIGEYEKSQALLEHLIKANAGDARSYFLLGQVYDVLKKYSLAIHSYKKAVSLDNYIHIPDNIDRAVFLELRKKRFKINLIVCACLVLFLIQFILFRSGILLPKMYDISLNNLDESILVDKSVQLSQSHKLFPFYGKDTGIKWVTADDEIASIDAGNILRAKKEGKVKISAVAGSKIIKSFDVSFVSPKLEKFTAKLDGKINNIGDSAKIAAELTMNNKDAVKPQISYKSSDENVLTVDKDGKVKAVGLGNVYVNVTAGNLSQSVQFSIKPMVTGMEIKYNNFELVPGQKFKINPLITMSPEGSAPADVSYEAQNDILKIHNDGTIEAAKQGYAEVTVRCGEFSSMVYVTVEPESSEFSQPNNALKASNSSNPSGSTDKCGVYENQKYGFSIFYPAGYTKSGNSANQESATFSNAKDNTQIKAYVSRNYGSRTAPRMMIKNILKIPYKVTYNFQKNNYYVLSWDQKGIIKYQKTIVGKDFLYSYEFSFPRGLENKYKSVVEMLSDSMSTPGL